MGCDIHSFVEQRDDRGEWQRIEPTWEPFENRSYRVFGFLAGVRNYSACQVIAAPRGVPLDCSDGVHEENESVWGTDGHTHSWLSVAELDAFDYSASVEDRRVTRGNDGGCTSEPGEGKVTTFREFLGDAFFVDLARLRAINSEAETRVVFWFDN